MERRNLLRSLVLGTLLIQILLFGLNAQVTVVEDFSTTNGNHPGQSSWGTVTGVNGIEWYMYNIRNTTGTLTTDTHYLDMEEGAKGYIMGYFEDAITEISFYAESMRSDDAEVEVYINNQSIGVYTFSPTGRVETISIPSPCKGNLLKIQFNRLVDSEDLYPRMGIDDLSITTDPAILTTCTYGSGEVRWILNGFGADAQTERYISWATPVGVTSTYVQYGETTALGTTEQDSIVTTLLSDNHPTEKVDDFLYHNAKLSGLNPNTTYYYRCGGDSGMSDMKSFTTAPAVEGPFTFAVVPDIQGDNRCSQGTDKRASFIVDEGVDFWLQLGDIVNDGGYIGQWYALLESGREVFENVPTMYCRGNHEAYGDDPDYLKTRTFFPFINNANRQFVFEYSNGIFVSLDNTKDEESNPWFADQLSNTTANWSFAYWHTNPYSTGGHGGDDLANLLPTYLSTVEQYNVTTVFNGHSHAYEWTHPIDEVGNPPVLSNATVYNHKLATAQKRQGTIFHNGSSGGAILATAAQAYTLTGDTAGSHRTVLIASVYEDSIVYEMKAYRQFTTGASTYQRGDVVHTYVVYDSVSTTNTLTTSSAGNGSVTPNGANVYKTYTKVSVTATPAYGYEFDSWTGDVPVGMENTNPVEIEVDADKNLVANFVILPTFTLTVTDGSGSGVYPEGEVIAITADPDPVGSRFSEWTGDIANVADVNDATTTITMLGDYAVTANFVVVDTVFPGGLGTISDPYHIANATQLQRIQNNLAAYYIVINDIDASETQTWNSGEGFIPIAGTFDGGLNGGGYTIDGLYIHPATGIAALFAGTFGSLGSEVVDLNLTNVDIVSADNNAAGLFSGTLRSPISGITITGSITAANHAYGFHNDTRTTTQYCSFSGTITAGGDAAGIMREINYTNTLRYCQSSGTITGHGNVGGIISWIRSIQVNNVYSNATITGSGNLGGIAGLSDNTANPSKSYFSGKIIPDGADNVGGIVGLIIGDYDNNCFWDNDTCPAVDTSVGTPKTTIEMRDIDTYTNTATVGLDNAWDMVAAIDAGSVWGILPGANNGYPFLQAFPPALATVYSLTVTSGSGSGNYEEAMVVPIAANTAPAGQEFDAWTGDVTNVADVNSESTTITMPASDVTITATYVDLPTYTLTVNSGTGSGTLYVGEQTTVTADAPSAGMEFNAWTGDIAGLADANSASTTLTMPGSDVTITATYVALPTYTLTVNSGTGSGTLYVGEQTTVTADPPSVGQIFDVWTGDIAGLADANSASTTLTMPASDVTITATYVDLPTYTLTVTNGTGSGDYLEDEEIVIGPNAAPAGEEFDVWTGDIAYLDNANLAAATVTMPAQAISLTATYRDTTTATYTLTVTNGSGSGDYVEAAVVPIVANTPPVGQQFSVWTGDVSNVADVNSATTTITMPASAANISATYVDIPTFTLTVNSGTGSGDYIEGATIVISPNTPPVGEEFDVWTGDISYLDDANLASATVTMPALAISLTATYVDTTTAAITYSVTFTVGDGSSPLENATISFNSDVKLTNVGGVVIFDNVSPGTDIAYNVALYGYDDLAGTLSVVDADINETVTMIEESTSIEEHESISIYPNPASEMITFTNINKVSNINIYTISNVLVKSINLENQNQMKVDISNLSKGMYYIQLITYDAIITKQQIVY